MKGEPAKAFVLPELEVELLKLYERGFISRAVLTRYVKRWRQ